VNAALPEVTTPATVEARARGLLAGRWPEGGVDELHAVVHALLEVVADPDAPLTASQARTATRLLNEHREFAHAQLLGRRWVEARDFDPLVAKARAQALIQLDALDEAEAWLRASLESLEQDGVAAEGQLTEYHALLARVARQRFVDGDDEAALDEATRLYLSTWRDAPAAQSVAPGMHAVALLRRQARDELASGLHESAEEVAQAVQREALKQLQSKPADPLLQAALSEAALALGELDAAELWLYRLLDHPSAAAAVVDAYDRQLQEVWQGRALGGGHPPADRLVAIIARHLVLAQGRMTVAAGAVPALLRRLREDPAACERQLPAAGGFGIEALGGLLEACGAIGCVATPSGERRGCGFLVRGDALSPAFGPDPVFVTSAHVASDAVAGATRLADVRVVFDAAHAGRADGAQPPRHPVQELLWSSPPGAPGERRGAPDRLDVALLRLRGLGPRPPLLRVAAGLPALEARVRVCVAGHVPGGGQQMALHDCVLLDIDDERRLVHYRTPVDGGGSGSPVLDARREVIALHHAGESELPRLHGGAGARYESSEGIALDAVRRALATR